MATPAQRQGFGRRNLVVVRVPGKNAPCILAHRVPVPKELYVERDFSHDIEAGPVACLAESGRRDQRHWRRATKCKSRGERTGGHRPWLGGSAGVKLVGVDELFAIDAEARRQRLSLEARHALRQEQSRPLLDGIGNRSKRHGPLHCLLVHWPRPATTRSRCGRSSTGSWNIPNWSWVITWRRTPCDRSQSDEKIGYTWEARRRDRRSQRFFRWWKAAADWNSQCATIWPRFFPDSLIARFSAYQTLLPLPGSPSIRRLKRPGCWRERDFAPVTFFERTSDGRMRPTVRYRT